MQFKAVRILVISNNVQSILPKEAQKDVFVYIIILLGYIFDFIYINFPKLNNLVLKTASVLLHLQLQRANK